MGAFRAGAELLDRLRAGLLRQLGYEACGGVCSTKVSPVASELAGVSCCQLSELAF
eukprot:COSAG01_NODE_2060_length_8520_cov_4.178839_13_plen_56_part_00